MKNIKMIGLGIVALMVSASLTNVMPSLASLLQVGESSVAQSPQKQPIQLQLAAERQSILAVASGRVEWISLPTDAAVRPGEILRYVVTASNTSDRPIKKLVVTQPIPSNAVYVLNSATLSRVEGAKLDYSIDGGKNYRENPTIRIKLDNGEIVERPAPASLYTNVRWNLGDTFPPQTIVNVSYQVRVR